MDVGKLIVSLGDKSASKLLPYFNDDELSVIIQSVNQIKAVDKIERDVLLKDFYDYLKSLDNQGGVGFVNTLLVNAFGSEKRNELMLRLGAKVNVKPFSFLNSLDIATLSLLLKNEHVQTLALIFSYLDSELVASLLMEQSKESQVDIAKRIAVMEGLSPEVLKEVEHTLEKKLETFKQTSFTQLNGLDKIVDVLNVSDAATRHNILERLDIDNPQLAGEIRKKLFTFDDIVKLSNKEVQVVLQGFDLKTICYALKGSKPEISDVVFSNVSKRMVDSIKDELSVMKPIRVSESDEAKQRIVDYMRKLEEQGKVILIKSLETDVYI